MESGGSGCDRRNEHGASNPIEVALSRPVAR
jgi:hypothetical protein